jgi:hypothetical protein
MLALRDRERDTSELNERHADQQSGLRATARNERKP